MAQQQQDVETLKRRGRRRLVGAVALVLAAVIILPMVFDPDPQSSLPPVSVRIPGENEAPYTPKGTPKPAAKKAEPQKPEAPKPEPAQGEYVIQVGAFAKPGPVVAKLAGAKLPYYTEPLSGNLVRVRAGPFATREAADKAVLKLKELGFTPGAVTTKSG